MEESHDTPAIAEIGSALDGRYTIIRQIGTGGMGDVYLATDLRHDRQVAIKVMRTGLKDGHSADRFLREISIAGRLSHPNIVPVYDSGQIGPLPYFVMPYLEGQSLRERLASEVQLSLDEALRTTFAVADALAYAHSHGFVHRDVKPENIILEGDHAIVADFGIAKAIQGTTGEKLTRDQTAVGTLAYMSPEQASASGKLDGRSDLYALALILYEMLAGDVPFHSATPEGMLARKALGRYASVRDVRGTVPKYVDDAIARALQPVPADRFASVSEFATALRGSSTPADEGRDRLRRWAVIVLAILSGAAITVAIATRRGPATAAPTPVIGLGRVVVAPLENRTADKSLDVVGVMAGDFITEGLQKTGIVEVVPSPTALQAYRYLGRESGGDGGLDPVRRLAAETGAGTVVSGAVYRQEGQLLFRVNVADRGGTRLVGTITDVVTPVSEPVRGVEELRNRLMGWLAVKYDDRLEMPGSLTGRPPTYEAYRAFNEGMNHYIAVENAKALPLFLQAFKLDSSFTVALLYASISLTNLSSWSSADSLLQLVNERRNSLSEYDRAWLDYRLAYVHGNHDAALAAIRTAARQAPESKASYNHALEALYGGYLREALSAVESVPADRGSMRGFAPYWELYGTILHVLRRYDAEHSIALRSRRTYPDRLTSFRSLARSLAATGQLDSLATVMKDAEGVPTDPVGWDYGHLLAEAADELRAHGYADAAKMYLEKLRQWLTTADVGAGASWRQVNALYALGKWDQAREQLAPLRRSDPASIEYLGMAGLIHGRKGERRQAELVADSLKRVRRAYQFGAGSVYGARIAAALGERDVAMARLKQASAEGRSYNLPLHREMDLEPLRGYPPFERLLRGKD